MNKMWHFGRDMQTIKMNCNKKVNCVIVYRLHKGLKESKQSKTSRGGGGGGGGGGGEVIGQDAGQWGHNQYFYIRTSSSGRCFCMFSLSDLKSEYVDWIWRAESLLNDFSKYSYFNDKPPDIDIHT